MLVHRLETREEERHPYILTNREPIMILKMQMNSQMPKNILQKKKDNKFVKRNSEISCEFLQRREIQE